MHLPEKKPFTTTSQAISEALIAFLARSPYRALHHEFDDLRFMANTISKHAKVPCTFHRGRAFDYIPEVSQTFFRVHLNGHTIPAGSTEFDDDLSKVKAKGEALERISTYLPFQALPHRDKPAVINPLKSKKKFVKSLLGPRIKRVPNDEIFYGFPGAKRKGQAVSTSGCAGHFSWHKAVLKGLLELIERDGFLVYWLNTISPIRVVPNEIDLQHSELKVLIKKLEAYNLTYYFLDITSDIGVPASVCVIAKGSGTGTRYFVGSGAGFTVTDTLISAAREALAIMGGRFELEPHILPHPHVPFSKECGVGHQERMRLYFTSEMEERFAFFINANKSESVSEFLSQHATIDFNHLTTSEKQLEFISRIFKHRYTRDTRWDVYIYNFSNPLLRTFDYHVVRVMCSALYDMYFHEERAIPNHPRLKEFVEKKGLSNEAKLNIWPHPYP